MSTTVPASHVVIFGRPGSGKSSLAERLAADFGFTMVRTGELLREAVRRDDDLGRRVGTYLRRGDLVPDPLILDLLQASIPDTSGRRFLFDGFPRTLGQVPLLQRFEAELGFTIDVYLEVALSREAAVERMSGRLACPVCGATYHAVTRPPRVARVCDHDGAALERRRDDAPEVIEQRQRVYERHTGPVLDYYRAHAPAKVFVVNGALPIEAVYTGACRALGLPTPPG